MTRALPFTEASLARAIRAVARAGKFVVGVRPDGTLVIADSPVDPACFAPVLDHNAGPPLAPEKSKWEDQPA